jgi:hypothetical protein
MMTESKPALEPHERLRCRRRPDAAHEVFQLRDAAAIPAGAQLAQ